MPVAHLIDGHGWTRRNAVLGVTGITALLAVPSALANGAVPFLSALPAIGLSFLDLMATIWNNFALPIGGLLLALFVGYVWRIDRAVEELTAEGAWFPYPAAWGALIGAAGSTRSSTP